MIGRIYRLEGGDKFYIGSTTCKLNYRLKKHRAKSKEQVALNIPVYVHFRAIGWNNATMILIEEFEITSKKQLLERECEIIKQFLGTENCLNKNRPVITNEEKKKETAEYSRKVRMSNPERERNRLEEWRRKNPEKRREQTARYYQRKKEKLLAEVEKHIS